MLWIDQAQRHTVGLRHRLGLAPQRLDSPIVEIRADDTQAREAAANVANHVHLTHRPAGTDDEDSVVCANLAGGGDVSVRLGRMAPRGTDPACHAVVQASDADRHQLADPPAAQHDVDDPAGGEFVIEHVDGCLVGAEVDDVVEAFVGQISDFARRNRLHFRRFAVRRKALGHAFRLAPVGHDDQQPAAGLDGVSFAGGVGSLDARPRFDQRHRRGALVLARRNQKTIPIRRDDHALVEQRVFLQAALKVVSERRVGAARRGQLAVVGLHQAALANLVMFHLIADGNDPADDFVSRHGGQAAGHGSFAFLSEPPARFRRRSRSCARACRTV